MKIGNQKLQFSFFHVVTFHSFIPVALGVNVCSVMYVTLKYFFLLII